VFVGQYLSQRLGPGNANTRLQRMVRGTAFISVRTMNDVIIALLRV
jgi:hypothetical protein